jgi:hypothetical protein
VPILVDNHYILWWVTIIRTQGTILSSFNANSFLIFSFARCLSSQQSAVAPAATLGGDLVRAELKLCWSVRCPRPDRLLGGAAEHDGFINDS